MDDIAIGGTRLDHAGAQNDHSAEFSAGMGPDRVVTAATRPFGVRVINPGNGAGTSVVTTEWFDTVQRRAEWIAQVQDVTVDRRTLIRLTDHDERGTFLGGREGPPCRSSRRRHARRLSRPGCATPTSNSASRPPNSARCCRPRPR